MRGRRRTRLTQLQDDIEYYKGQIGQLEYVIDQMQQKRRPDTKKIEKLHDERRYFLNRLDHAVESFHNYRQVWTKHLLTYQPGDRDLIMVEDPENEGFVIDITDLVDLYEQKHQNEEDSQ